MSGLTIGSLPEEVLIEIFKLLDLETLKEVVLTCKRWRNIAEQSIPWSMKLYAHGRSRSSKAILKRSERILTSKRKYTTIIADNLHVRDGRMEHWMKTTMDTFEKFGPNIVTLQLNRCYFKDLKRTIDFFNLMKNVKKLIFFRTTCDTWRGDIEALPSFSKLKELESIWSDSNIFELFKEAELESLKINDWTCDKPLKRFLATQKSLKTLAMRSHNQCSELFEAPIADEDIPFKLTELSLVNVNLKENRFNNLSTFMSLHRTTIEKLELSSELPDFIFELVFAEFKNLKSLRLNADMMPTNTEFFDRLEYNESVTTLTLVDKADPSISQLFKHLPNIEHIELQEESNYETLESIAENLKKLKKLKVKRFSGTLFRNLNFPTVEALSIESVGQIQWDLFARQAPNITHIFINDCDDRLGNVNIKKIMEGFKIESLTINSDVLADDEFFAVIRTYGSSLKSLSLSSRSLATKERSTEVANVRGLSFHEHPVKDPLSTGEGAWNDESCPCNIGRFY